jgi:hypothetical protein
MALPAEKPQPATYADLEGVPAHLVAEIINGELHTMPRPAPKHAKPASALGVLVFGLSSERIWMLTGVYRGEARVKAKPFDAIELDLTLLWAK